MCPDYSQSGEHSALEEQPVGGQHAVCGVLLFLFRLSFVLDPGGDDRNSAKAPSTSAISKPPARAGIADAEIDVVAIEIAVYLNNIEFKLTPAAIESLSVLAEARMDGDILNGTELEAMISGRLSSDCDEAAGATRIKRLRDALGNQMVSELLVKNIARKGYMLSIDSTVIKMV